jgi:hypothetical protein
MRTTYKKHQKAAYSRESICAENETASYFCHLPNAPRNAIAGVHAKALGAKAGVPHLLMIRDGFSYLLELKASRGRLSPEQRATHVERERAGAVVGVAFGLDAAITQLKKWGLLRDVVV